MLNPKCLITKRRVTIAAEKWTSEKMVMNTQLLWNGGWRAAASLSRRKISNEWMIAIGKFPHSEPGSPVYIPTSYVTRPTNQVITKITKRLRRSSQLKIDFHRWLRLMSRKRVREIAEIPRMELLIARFHICAIEATSCPAEACISTGASSTETERDILDKRL